MFYLEIFWSFERFFTNFTFKILPFLMDQDMPSSQVFRRIVLLTLVTSKQKTT